MPWLWSCPAGARHLKGEPMAWVRCIGRMNECN
jgi:hypothetical protein